MDVLTFNNPTKHGTLSFHPKLTYGFEGADAAPYLIANGWAKVAPKGTEPDVVISAEEFVVDPETIQNESGLKVADLIAGSE